MNTERLTAALRSEARTASFPEDASLLEEVILLVEEGLFEAALKKVPCLNDDCLAERCDNRIGIAAGL